MKKTLVMIWLMPLFFAAQVSPVLTDAFAQRSNNLSMFVNSEWRFGRGDGSVIAKRIRLLPGGRIDGYDHPNENHWGVERGYLVFYHKNGKPSCRFKYRHRRNGRMVLRGQFLYNRHITHVLEEVALSQPSPNYTNASPVSDFTNSSWRFGRGDGSVIAERIKLLPGGKIEGYYHPNEDHWGVEDGYLVFYHKNGTPSCRFSYSSRMQHGQKILTGLFLLNRNITHVLTGLPVVQPPRGYTSVAPSWDYTESIWQFSRGDGSLISGRIRLLPGGKIQGYYHPNEDHWGVEDGYLIFYHKNGSPSCRFRFSRFHNGRRILRGPFLFNRNIIHVLRAIPPH